MRTPLLLLASLAASLAYADNEYDSSKVKLIAHFDLAQLGAKSGNTCWGYVSKAGREYALMGCSNSTAFIEVTDPYKAKIVAKIPHSEGLWSDIKVYKDTVYVSTENSGSGIQVIDVSKIDTGVVTLIQTIKEPGRSHTIAVDPDGPYLYTCGSNEGVGKGATTCFSIKDPNNPVRFGAPTMTPVYQHESQVVTYKSGKYKGKTIMFGGGEGRGLEIWDLTDKDKPSLVKRVAYPFVGYCHQGWLSSDRKYFYVNDEFDESTNAIATRTLVFDVSDLEKADLVSTYTTNKASIDHNLYTRNDFVFHANYTSGLWIFNANETPLTPKLCGFFDTYPQDDKAHFDGAWSNYPLLPSGIVLISDINSGLFIVDASEATKTAVRAKSVKAEGSKATLSLDALADADDNAASVDVKNNATLVFDGVCKWQSPSKLGFEVRSKGNKNASQTVEFYNWKTGKYEQAKSTGLTTSFDSSENYVKGVSDYIQADTKAIRARVTLKAKGNASVSVDKASFVANP